MKEPDPESRTMQGFVSGLIGLYGSRLSTEEYLKESMQEELEKKVNDIKRKSRG